MDPVIALAARTVVRPKKTQADVDAFYEAHAFEDMHRLRQALYRLRGFLTRRHSARQAPKIAIQVRGV